MGARLYDEAVVDKIRKWVKDPNVLILKPGEVKRFLEITADESKDRITLPQIHLSRSGYRVLNANKMPKSFDGITLVAYDEDGHVINEGKAMKLNAIPIQLEYQLDIYTARYEECDEYARNFVFNFVNYPTGEVLIPYNGANVHHKFTIHLESDVEDTSDVPQRLFPTQFTRHTLSFVIDDAYLFSIPVRNNVEIVGYSVSDAEGDGMDSQCGCSL